MGNPDHIHYRHEEIVLVVDDQIVITDFDLDINMAENIHGLDRPTYIPVRFTGKFDHIGRRIAVPN